MFVIFHNVVLVIDAQTTGLNPAKSVKQLKALKYFGTPDAINSACPLDYPVSFVLGFEPRALHMLHMRSAALS